MEEVCSNRFDGIGNAVRKKRSQTCRRPRPDSQPFGESHDREPSSSTPSDDISKVSSDENVGCENNSKRKLFSLNQCISRISSFTGADDEKPRKRIKKQDELSDVFYHSEVGRSGSNNKQSSEGVLAPANLKRSSKVNEGLGSQSRNADTYGGRNGESQSSGQLGVILDGLGNDNKVKKVKLKVGGVKRTIHANPTHNDGSGGRTSTKSSHSSDASKSRHKQNLQGNSDDEHSPLSDKRSGLQGIPWKDFSRGGLRFVKEDYSTVKMAGKNSSGKQGDKSEPVRKSKRVPKRRLMDGEFDAEEDDEIRYLEKLRTTKVSVGYKEDHEELSKKQQKLSSISNTENTDASRSGKDVRKKSRPDRVSEDTDYVEEDELASDCEFEGKKKKPLKESVESLMDNKREMTLTTRQRALQSSKDASTGSSLIEFPNGLPPAPTRKQKEKLSEVEQQLKKAEAAQRRRMQVEKAARESEAEAIRKILGQDSNRKKREDKIKKRLEELAQEKAANALMNASNTIRWVMGPNGTVVTFPKEMGLPSMFDSKPCSYPPPRENCAGPSCTNPYRYRDSKSKLPLCSLQCYKAIQKKTQAETTC